MGIAPFIGAGALDFTKVAGQFLILDARNITLADGTAISTGASAWPDTSGNGNNATQSTAADQPVFYKTTSGNLINGHPAVKFDGTDDFLNSPIGTTAPPLTVFVVASCSNVSTGPALFCPNDGGGASRFQFGIKSGGTAWNLYNGNTTTGGSPDSNPHVLTAQTSLGGGAVIRVDGSTVGIGTGSSSGGFDGGGLNIGTVWSSANIAYWTGLIAFVLASSSQLTTTQMQLVENALLSGFGI